MSTTNHEAIENVYGKSARNVILVTGRPVMLVVISCPNCCVRVPLSVHWPVTR